MMFSKVLNLEIIFVTQHCGDFRCEKAQENAQAEATG